jgi:hypothetical protein
VCVCHAPNLGAVPSSRQPGNVALLCRTQLSVSSVALHEVMIAIAIALLGLAPQRRVQERVQQAAASPAASALSTATPFVQAASNGLPPKVDATFRAWPALNNETTRRAVNAGRRFRLHLLEVESGFEDPTRNLFLGDALMSRFAMALAEKKAIDRKEFFEACEFFARVRTKMRSDDGTLYDVAGGHGLVGTLFAIFVHQIDHVVVRDPKRPKAFDAVVAAAIEVAPWVEGKIVFEQDKIGPGHEPLPRGCAVVCVHGCRGLTDQIIAAAATADARAVALMPCCYKSTAAEAPEALRLTLGVPLAADVHRTYELERLGFTVAWSAIPSVISPMNRIILAHRPARSQIEEEE